MKNFFGSVKEFFENAIDTIRDDRWSWKFKVCNILTNDWLRIELASANGHIHKIRQDIESMKKYPADELESYRMFLKWSDVQTNKALESIYNIWRI